MKVHKHTDHYPIEDDLVLLKHTFPIDPSQSLPGTSLEWVKMTRFLLGALLLTEDKRPNLGKLLGLYLYALVLIWTALLFQHKSMNCYTLVLLLAQIFWKNQSLIFNVWSFSVECSRYTRWKVWDKFFVMSSGARPKEPRPDLVPSTPPLGEASGFTPAAEASETSERGEESTAPAKTAFRLKQQSTTISDDQASLSDIHIQTDGSSLAMQELERKLSAAQIEQNIDFTQRWEEAVGRCVSIVRETRTSVVGCHGNPSFQLYIMISF